MGAAGSGWNPVLDIGESSREAAPVEPTEVDATIKARGILARSVDDDGAGTNGRPPCLQRRGASASRWSPRLRSSASI